MNGRGQARAHTRGILRQHEDSKDVAKDHSHQDHADAGEREKAPRAERRKTRSVQLRRGNQRVGCGHMGYPYLYECRCPTSAVEPQQETRSFETEGKSVKSNTL